MALAHADFSKALHYLLSPCNLVSERANEVPNQDKGVAGLGGGGTEGTSQGSRPRWRCCALCEGTVALVT